MNAIHRTIPIGFNFICEAPDRDSDGNRQENPPEYNHKVCGDSDGLVLRTVLECARKRNLHLRIQMSEAEMAFISYRYFVILQR